LIDLNVSRSESFINAGTIVTEIVGKHLTTFEVAADGKECRLNLIDRDGQPAAVILPVDCLKELLLTLPRVIARALQATYHDDTVRVAYHLDRWGMERAHDGRLILTMGTQDGFEISFAVWPSDLERIAYATADYDKPPGDSCERAN